METIKKHKWIIHWCAFSGLAAVFVLFAVFYEDKTWIGNVLQAIGTVTGIYLTLIIFLHSKEGSDKQFKEHLDHLQNLNHKQIEALQGSTEKQIAALQDFNAKQIEALLSSTEKQIATLQELNAKHIDALQNVTEKQITALQDLTEKQITALHKTTSDEISAFEKQTVSVTNKLSDNSVLLAEILGRELEKSISLFNDAIVREEARYKDLSGFKLLRTKEEKQEQLDTQWNKIEQIKRGYDYLVNKYNQVKSFLGFGHKGLNG